MMNSKETWRLFWLVVLSLCAGVGIAHMITSLFELMLEGGLIR